MDEASIPVNETEACHLVHLAADVNRQNTCKFHCPYDSQRDCIGFVSFEGCSECWYKALGMIKE